MSQSSFVLFGNQSILAQCGGKILGSGNTIAAIVTESESLLAWAVSNGIKAFSPDAQLGSNLSGVAFDWLLSLAYLSVIPDEILKLAKMGAVNYHDGPLPEYAGLNTPVWARINQASEHGITWHVMERGVDKGDIIEQRRFTISDDDTAFSLNTKCFEAAVESFDSVLAQLLAGQVQRVPQVFDDRRYFLRSDRPANHGLIDFHGSSKAVVALVNGLDHHTYWNPLTTAKIALNGVAYTVGNAVIVDGHGESGDVLDVSDTAIKVATDDGVVSLSHLMQTNGRPLAEPLPALLDGSRTLSFDANETLSQNGFLVAKTDAHWREKLADMPGASLSFCHQETDGPEIQSIEITNAQGKDVAFLAPALLAWACRQQEGSTATVAIAANPQSPIGNLISPWKPLSVNGQENLDTFLKTASEGYQNCAQKDGFACDLLARAPELDGVATPDIGFSETSDFIEGTAVTFCAVDGCLKFDASRISNDAAAMLAKRLDHTLTALATTTAAQMFETLDVIPPEEMDMLLRSWNQTDVAYDASKLLHHPFEDCVQRTPDKVALVFDDLHWTYQELDAQASALAHRLAAAGIGKGDVVGLFMPRAPDMVAAAFAILRTGAAYLSLDPSYPADRNQYCLSDSAARAVITHSSVVAKLPSSSAMVIVSDRSEQDPKGKRVALSAAAPDDLAYMIYTSGSTGHPKGVMVEHRNVANFFAGMDARIPHEPAGSWLAVTSLSFDISILEIFWTLGRGFKLVLTGDEAKTVLSNGPLPSQVSGMDFSLYYWGNDDGVGRDKYKLLLEGAKYADQHGFSAVWTPERHFHAFGGPYPNPSVTGAAVAAVTGNLAVRAGSCVAPLHHTARIAEEWSVIDNLTNGRAGLAIASGWQPDDFVLRPENTPPNNRDAMFQSIEDLRKLWSGEPVAFPKADGSMHDVVTQPRPVSKKLPIWVTTAGNPETWRRAGEIGANVLTHLLGQSIPEVGGKIRIYHDALRANGHDPKDFAVTLMLHSYLAEDREQAREIAREPMKDYLRSAAGLIKQFAWAFPAFKRPKGVDNAFQLDLGTLDDDELEAILDFAFLRYFEDSGLFGTVADAMKRVEEVKKIGVTEIACLIDYGIEANKVLEGLRPVAEVVRRCNEGAKLEDDDFSVAAQILRHNVTHMQCTPSMAQLFLANDETRQALAEIDTILLGGEALPGALVKDINAISNAEIQNMYGPTETTIWSTTGPATAVDGTVSIGTPIANTKIYVLDDDRRPVPIGKPGELWIGGDGVARGYWNQPDLTEQRFVSNPFSTDAAARMYQTGDLVSWMPDGTLDYIGRTDFQVKIRGFRIELGEIEAAMDAFSDIGQSAVVVRQEGSGDLRIVGYYTTIGAVKSAEFKAFLGTRLPAHMVPSELVALDSMPLTPNKKIDRKALLSLRAAPIVAHQVSAPSTSESDAPIEQQLTAIWRAILGVSNISSSDNFFEIGGHSLLAVQAHRDIRQKLKTEKLSITDIFRFPMLKDLTARVESLMGVGTTEQTPSQGAQAAETSSKEKTELRTNAIERRRAMRARRNS